MNLTITSIWWDNGPQTCATKLRNRVGTCLHMSVNGPYTDCGHHTMNMIGQKTARTTVCKYFPSNFSWLNNCTMKWQHKQITIKFNNLLTLHLYRLRSSEISHLEREMNREWPTSYSSQNYGFWRHEYCKHGTCCTDKFRTAGGSSKFCNVLFSVR